MTLEELLERDDLLEVGRKAVEEVLIDFRESRLSVFRNNGLVCKEKDGAPSAIIRLGTEQAVTIALKAIIEHLEGNP